VIALTVWSAVLPRWSRETNPCRAATAVERDRAGMPVGGGDVNEKRAAQEGFESLATVRGLIAGREDRVDGQIAAGLEGTMGREEVGSACPRVLEGKARDSLEPSVRYANQ